MNRCSAPGTMSSSKSLSAAMRRSASRSVWSGWTWSRRARRHRTSGRRSPLPVPRRASSRRARRSRSPCRSCRRASRPSARSFASSSGCVAQTTSWAVLPIQITATVSPSAGSTSRSHWSCSSESCLSARRRAAAGSGTGRAAPAPCSTGRSRGSCRAPRSRARPRARGRSPTHPPRVVAAAPGERDRAERRCEPDLHSSVGRRPIRLASRSARSCPPRTVHTPSVIGSSMPRR